MLHGMLKCWAGRICLAGLVCMALVLMVRPEHAAEDGYVRRFIWTKKEVKEAKKLAKKVKKDDEGFFVYETEHWLIKTQISEQFTAEAAVYIELFQSVFENIFDFTTGAESSLKPTFVVFDSETNYMKIRGIPNSRGVFMWAARGDKFEIFHLYTYMNSGAQRLFEYAYHPVIKHEATHCLLQGKMGTIPIPVWLNEGMAMFYENWDLRAKISKKGNSRKDREAREERLRRSKMHRVLRQYVRDTQDFPRLKTLVSLNRETWSPDNMGPQTLVHYALSESFVDALLSDKDGRVLLAKMFERVAKKQPPITDEEVEKFEMVWYEYLDEGWRLPVPEKVREYMKEQKKKLKKK